MSLRIDTSPTIARPETGEGPARSTLVAWFVGFAALVFVIPFVATELLEMHHDLYYLVYGSLVVLYLAVFLSRVATIWREFARRNIGWSIALGILVAVASVRNVLADDSTPHPEGAFFGFELMWRGLFYGLIDALALFVFPALVAYLFVRGDRRGFVRKVEFGALTLALTLIVTATYHLGYSQFRNLDLVNPEIGAVMMSVPAIVTGNPVGALVAHSAVHITAVAHEYEGADPGYLPPNLNRYPDHWGGTLGWVLAALWMSMLASVVWISRLRLFGHTQRASSPANRAKGAPA